MKLLSSIACKFNLRRYNKDIDKVIAQFAPK